MITKINNFYCLGFIQNIRKKSCQKPLASILSPVHNWRHLADEELETKKLQPRNLQAYEATFWLWNFIAWWKLRQTFGRIQEEISENQRRSLGFSSAGEFSQTLPRFSLRKTCFISFIKLSFSVLIGKKMVKEARM